MSTIECTYLMRAHCLKMYLLYFYRTQHHLVEMNKTPAQLGYRKSGTHARVLSQHSPLGTERIHTYDIEKRYEEILLAYL